MFDVSACCHLPSFREFVQFTFSQKLAYILFLFLHDCEISELMGKFLSSPLLLLMAIKQRGRNWQTVHPCEDNRPLGSIFCSQPSLSGAAFAKSSLFVTRPSLCLFFPLF